MIGIFTSTTFANTVIKAEDILSPAALACDIPKMLKQQDYILTLGSKQKVIFDQENKILFIDHYKFTGIYDYKINNQINKNENHRLEMYFTQASGKIVIKKFVEFLWASDEGESNGYYYIIMKPNSSDLTDFIKKFNLKSSAENDWAGGIFEKLPSGNVKVSCTVAG